MVQILHLDSSPRAERSHSRAFSLEFVTAWQSTHPEDGVTYRDLGRYPVPHVDEPWVAAAFTPPEARSPDLAAAIALSDQLVDEFMAADRYVFGVPMYNFVVPSTFKAYVDQIVRLNRTFNMDASGYIPLVPPGKKMMVITTRGASYSLGSPAAAYDLQEPFIRNIFNFIGVTDITFIHVENIDMGDEAREQAFASAHVTIQSAVASW